MFGFKFEISNTIVGYGQESTGLADLDSILKHLNPFSLEDTTIFVIFSKAFGKL